MYKLIDHTADFGIEITAKDRTALFEAAATALFELLVKGPQDLQPQLVTIEVTGNDWPDLLVNWLRELLYLWSGRELRLVGVNVASIEPYQISAQLKTQPFDPDNDRVKQEIKAVTYHQVTVETDRGQWVARVIFDV